MSDVTSWGSDVPISMPEPIDESEVLIDMGSHAFTPDGLRIVMSRSVREEIVSSSYTPVDGGDG